MFGVLALFPLILPPAMLRPSLDYYNSNFATLLSPEVIDNRARINIANGYQYPTPEIPVNFDEPTQGTPLISPSSTYLPPLPENESPIYDQLPPVPPQNAYLPYVLSKTPNNNIKILNMSCIDSPSSKFFRASFQTDAYLNFPPIIEDARSDCIFGFGNMFNLNLDGAKLQECGVRRCGNGNLCVKLRIASVKGLRLADDVSVLLLCRPQEAVASHVRSIKFNPRVVQGRALSPVASGGTQRKFDTEVALYRRAAGIGEFTEMVIPGSSVQLGEDLLLRGAVREGDGWMFSRMGPVTMQRPSPLSTSLENFVTLVDETGCRPQSMKSVCPQQPGHISPLVIALPIKAFMFQDANPGDEMILSVRMHGCVRFEDCRQSSSCEEEKVQRRQLGGRLKRETKNGTRSGAVKDWRSYLEFRVVVPEENRVMNDGKSKAIGFDEFLTLTNLFIPAVWVLGIVCTLTFAVLILIYVCGKMRQKKKYGENQF